MTDRPKTIPEFFDFYYDRFKLIYSHLQLLNEPPIEMFFEVNAAFDHLSRHWKYNESEEEAVDSACRHLKRGCFDGFKIVVREARRQYDALMEVDLTSINQGQFQRDMIELFASITKGAINARLAEGDSRDESRWHEVFDLWEEVYINCVEFEKVFFQSKDVEWIKSRARKRIWRSRLEGLVVGLLCTAIWSIFQFGYNSIYKSDSNTNSQVAIQAKSEPPKEQEEKNFLLPAASASIDKAERKPSKVIHETQKEESPTTQSTTKSVIN